MDKMSFEILRSIAENSPEITQEPTSEKIGMDPFLHEGGYGRPEKKGLLDGHDLMTEKGLDALAPFKIDNAVILATGMSTRFVPVFYELPKRLISIRGEVMTERLIRQLLISCIMEKFFICVRNTV